MRERDTHIKTFKPGRKNSHSFRDALHKILSLTNSNYSPLEYFRHASSSILDYSGSDMVHIRLQETGNIFRYQAEVSLAEKNGQITEKSYTTDTDTTGEDLISDPVPRSVFEGILSGGVTAVAPSFTREGSFWTGDSAQPIMIREQKKGIISNHTVVIGGDYQSLAIIPIPMNRGKQGILFLGSHQRDYFRKEDILLYEAIAETLGVAISHQKALWALRERIKELTCLYEVGEVARANSIGIDELLDCIVNILPKGWQYPGITCARIRLDDKTFISENFKETPPGLHASIKIRGQSKGKIDIYYLEHMPDLDEGPFLMEERNLINEIARQVGVIIERWDTEQEKSRIQEQLWHADRLATIGQLSAGVAHELNEPLGAILGFAELIRENTDLSEGVIQDTDKIIKASLHAREIIRKLMIFTRQVHTRKEPCNINEVVEKGLYFLESRCAKEGITLVRELQEELPSVIADPSQIHQVLVNLMVNAIQAMDDGGVLTIKTIASDDMVSLFVTDTGSGMHPDIKQNIFLPFFTTKDVGEGVGLGLSVVHGIVTSHGGSVHVVSDIGQGSTIEIRLPVMTFSKKES